MKAPLFFCLRAMVNSLQSTDNSQQSTADRKRSTYNGQQSTDYVTYSFFPSCYT